MATKVLIVKLTAKGSDKPLFERDVYLDGDVTLSNFPFSSVIDALDVLYKKVPHDVEFLISEV